MKRWHICLLIGGVAALVVHFAVLHKIPSLIMSKAQDRFEAGGTPLNQWVSVPRITPQTQSVVRPSPDLAYAICRFDVREGPVRLSAPRWDGTGSLSVFDERTNNVFVASLNSADHEGDDASTVKAVLIIQRGGDVTVPDSQEQVIQIKGEGLALIRRLAPDVTRHEAASLLVDGAECGPSGDRE